MRLIQRMWSSSSDTQLGARVLSCWTVGIQSCKTVLYITDVAPQNCNDTVTNTLHDLIFELDCSSWKLQNGHTSLLHITDTAPRICHVCGQHLAWKPHNSYRSNSVLQLLSPVAGPAADVLSCSTRQISYQQYLVHFTPYSHYARVYSRLKHP